MSSLTDFLQRNADNRGVMATLRQGLTPATETRAWPLLAQFNGIGRKADARAVRTVAALFAHHPAMSDTGNMGDTCRALCNDNEHPWETVDAKGKAIAPGPMSRKFSWLLASDTDEIFERVARMVLYAKSKGVPVNYAQLEKDLARWTDQRVREAWASAFWAPKAMDSESEEERA